MDQFEQQSLLEEIAREAHVPNIEDSRTEFYKDCSTEGEPMPIGPAELLKREYPNAPPESVVFMFMYNVMSRGGKVETTYETYAALTLDSESHIKIAKILTHKKIFETESA